MRHAKGTLLLKGIAATGYIQKNSSGNDIPRDRGGEIDARTFSSLSLSP